MATTDASCRDRNCAQDGSPGTHDMIAVILDVPCRLLPSVAVGSNRLTFRRRHVAHWDLAEQTEVSAKTFLLLRQTTRWVSRAPARVESATDSVSVMCTAGSHAKRKSELWVPAASQSGRRIVAGERDAEWPVANTGSNVRRTLFAKPAWVSCRVARSGIPRPGPQSA